MFQSRWFWSQKIKYYRVFLRVKKPILSQWNISQVFEISILQFPHMNGLHQSRVSLKVKRIVNTSKNLCGRLKDIKFLCIRVFYKIVDDIDFESILFKLCYTFYRSEDFTRREWKKQRLVCLKGVVLLIDDSFLMFFRNKIHYTESHSSKIKGWGVCVVISGYKDTQSLGSWWRSKLLSNPREFPESYVSMGTDTT